MEASGKMKDDIRTEEYDERVGLNKNKFHHSWDFRAEENVPEWNNG